MTAETTDNEFIEIGISSSVDDDAVATATTTDDDVQQVETESADQETEASDKDKIDDDLQKQKKPANGAQARIFELTRLRRQAERERDQALAQLQGARNSAEAAETKPTPDNFEDYGDYVEALTDWKADQRDAKRVNTYAEKAAETAAQHKSSEWSAKVAAITESLPNYAEVAGKSDTIVRDHVVEAIMDADRGPELVYYLAQNPDVAARLNDMSPARAAIELGKIETKLGDQASSATTPARKTTSAPAPITPVASGSTTAKDPAKMNMEDYVAYRKTLGINR